MEKAQELVSQLSKVSKVLFEPSNEQISVPELSQLDKRKEPGPCFFLSLDPHTTVVDLMQPFLGLYRMPTPAFYGGQFLQAGLHVDASFGIALIPTGHCERQARPSSDGPVSC